MAKVPVEQGVWPGRPVPGWVPEVVLPSVAVPEGTSAAEFVDAVEYVVSVAQRLYAFAARFTAAGFTADSDLHGDLRGDSRRVDAFVAEIASITRQAPFNSTRYLTTALTLTERLPDTMREFEHGGLPWQHAEIISEGVQGLDRQQPQNWNGGR